MATILTKSLREQRKGKDYDVKFRSRNFSSNELIIHIEYSTDDKATCHYHRYDEKMEISVGINNIEELNKAVPGFTSEIVETRSVGNEYVHNVHYIDDKKLNAVCEYFYHKEKAKKYNNLRRQKRDGYYAQYFDNLYVLADYLGLKGDTRREFIVDYGSKLGCGDCDQDDLNALKTITIAMEKGLKAFRLGRSGYVAAICKYLGYETERRRDATGYNVYKKPCKWFDACDCHDDCGKCVNGNEFEMYTWHSCMFIDEYPKGYDGHKRKQRREELKEEFKNIFDKEE